jgi:hypothetical protein
MEEAKNGTAESASLIIRGKIPMLRVPSSAASQASQQRPLESVEGYVLAYYYAALTNLFCQVYLSPIDQSGDDDNLKTILDASYRDFFMLASLLGALDQNEIKVNPSLLRYLEARELWRNLVKNGAMISEKGRENTSNVELASNGHEGVEVRP